LLRLRHGHVFAVANHPRRHRRAERVANIGPLALGDLLLIEQPVIVQPQSGGFVPDCSHGGLL
jgi:hypothetical protein